MFKPNIHWVSLWSEIFERKIRVKVTQRALRSIDKIGGLDNYLLLTKNRHLNSKTAQFWKKKLLKQKKSNHQKDFYFSVIEYNAKKLAEYIKENKPEFANWTPGEPSQFQIEVGKRLREKYINSIQQRREFKFRRGNKKVTKNLSTRYKHYKPWVANVYVPANEQYGLPEIVPAKGLKKESGVLFRG